MNDLIKIAQDLRSEFNNERQDWLRERGGERIEMPLDCTVLYGDNEARHVIEALAEETYEYAVQAKVGGKWEYKQDGFFRDAWFSELQKAKGGARELRSIGRETRIVRRRISPAEVINE